MSKIRPFSEFFTFFTQYRQQEQRDYAIAMKIPHFMRKPRLDRTGTENYVRKQNEIAAYLRGGREDAALTMITGNMISYGWK